MLSKETKIIVICLAAFSLILIGLARFVTSVDATTTQYSTFTFKISPAGSGTVTGTGVNCPSDCTNQFVKTATDVYSSYSANPATGYVFVGWENSPSVRAGMDYKNDPLNISKKSSWTLTANFVAVPVGVAVCQDQNANNTGAALPCTYDPPTVVTDNNTGAATSDTGDSIVADDTPVAAVDNTDTEAPTVPQDLVGEYNSDDSSTALSWTDATDNTAVTGYEIQRQEKGQTTWESVGNVQTTQFTDFKFSPDKTYIYQVRAYDAAKNFSDWSTSVQVATGKFKPNVTSADGGTVVDSEGIVTVDIPPGAVSDDVVFIVNKVDVKGLKLPGELKLVGSYYDIKAKKLDGSLVTKFNKPIKVTFDYSMLDLSSGDKNKLVISDSSDGKSVETLTTNIDGNNISGQTSHLSYYFLAVKSDSWWVTLVWIIGSVIVIAIAGVGAYFGWQRYKILKYRKSIDADLTYPWEQPPTQQPPLPPVQPQ